MASWKGNMSCMGMTEVFKGFEGRRANCVSACQTSSQDVQYFADFKIGGQGIAAIFEPLAGLVTS